MRTKVGLFSLIVVVVALLLVVPQVFARTDDTPQGNSIQLTGPITTIDAAGLLTISGFTVDAAAAETDVNQFAVGLLVRVEGTLRLMARCWPAKFRRSLKLRMKIAINLN